MANGTIAASQLEMLSQSGTGIITITPPATNTNRAITLPDAAGAIVVSGTTPSLNGITFPATQVPSADANTLDDFEEGTWTPVAGRGDIGSAGSAITAVYSTQTGKYTKIGSLVIISGLINITSVSSQGSGNNFISGLPFTPADNSLGAAAVARNDAFTTSVIINSFAWGSARMFFVANTNSSSAVSVDWKSGIVNFTFSYFV
jgi:hypothetical protein